MSSPLSSFAAAIGIINFVPVFPASYEDAIVHVTASEEKDRIDIDTAQVRLHEDVVDDSMFWQEDTVWHPDAAMKKVDRDTAMKNLWKIEKSAGWFTEHRWHGDGFMGKIENKEYRWNLPGKLFSR